MSEQDQTDPTKSSGQDRTKCEKMSTRNPNPTDFTVVQLKEILQQLGLSSAGNKAELINRLMEADPSGAWASGVPALPEVSATTPLSEGKVRRIKFIIKIY